MVLEDNVVTWALGVAKVTDKTIDFDELMGKRNDGAIIERTAGASA